MVPLTKEFLSHIGEEEHEFEESSARGQSQSKQPNNAATQSQNESVVRNITPKDFDVEIKSLMQYEYFYQKMAQIKPTPSSGSPIYHYNRRPRVRNDRKPPGAQGTILRHFGNQLIPADDP